MPYETKTDMLTRVLTERINSGHYPPGEPLPSGAELQREFKVSQQVVRTAIAVLKARELVYTQYGIGVFVKEKA